MRIPRGVVNNTATPGMPSKSLAHVGLYLFKLTGTIGLEDDEHVRQRVRHRIFRPLRASRPAKDVLHFRDLSEFVFDTMI